MLIVVCYDMVDDTVGGGRAGCREVLHAGESFASSFPALPEPYDCLVEAYQCHRIADTGQA